jgi:hypothetical protein
MISFISLEERHRSKIMRSSRWALVFLFSLKLLCPIKHPVLTGEFGPGTESLLDALRTESYHMVANELHRVTAKWVQVLRGSRVPEEMLANA